MMVKVGESTQAMQVGASKDGGCKWELASGSKRRWWMQMGASKWEQAAMAKENESK
jgi:hypothetical protein